MAHSTPILRTLTTDKGDRVATSLTDAEALAIVANLDSDLARSLVSQAGSRGLSPNQIVWTHKLAIEHGQRQSRRTVPLGDFRAITSMFEHAGGKLRYPRIRFERVADLGAVHLVLAGKGSKQPGSINVTDGHRGGAWYGRITRAGEFQPSRASTPELEKFLKAFAEDPAGVAAAEGKRTGSCCFCAKQLTDERSVAVGYGPQCAEKFSLPWG